MVEVGQSLSRVVVGRLDETPGAACPCGTAYRVVRGADGAPASVHFVDVKVDSELHYHRTFTEIYTCLEGSGTLEADGESIPLEPGVVVVIPPGVRHRPRPGTAASAPHLRILNVVVPPFSEDDEWLD